MNINEIKLTENMINLALKESLPPVNAHFKNEPLPFKKVFMTKHAMIRFEERFGKGFEKIDIAKQIAASLKNGYHSLTFKDIPSFALLVNFGEVTASVQLLKCFSQFDATEEIYLVKTLYLKMNEFFLEKMNTIHDEKIQDMIFEKMMKDQFFKGKTEKDIFERIKKPSEKIIKKVRKAINESYKMVDPIKELNDNSSLLEETIEKEQYKFGDGVEEKPIEKVTYINHDEFDPLDSLLDESLFDIPEENNKFKFGDNDVEYIPQPTEKENPLGLDLDSSDFPW